MSRIVDEWRNKKRIKISTDMHGAIDLQHIVEIGDRMADHIERLERLVGLLREHYTMSYTPELAPRMDELKKQIDEQIACEENT